MMRFMIKCQCIECMYHGYDNDDDDHNDNDNDNDNSAHSTGDDQPRHGNRLRAGKTSCNPVTYTPTGLGINVRRVERSAGTVGKKQATGSPRQSRQSQSRRRALMAISQKPPLRSMQSASRSDGKRGGKGQ